MTTCETHDATQAGFRGMQGFTLLEILVALVILSMAATVVFQLFSANLKALSASTDRVAAMVRAQAAIREVLDKEDLDAGSWKESTEDGYGIDVDVSETLEERTKDLPVKMLDVSVTIHWKRDTKEKTFTLRTMKMVTRKV
jgi:type II secretion system protein I